MDLKIDSLRTFVAVADKKGFTKAALLVNRSQSAVSMQIKRLEEEVGNRLFHRIGKSVQLTSVGNNLIKFARVIVKNHDDAVIAISNPGMVGTIRFGSSEHYTASILPKLLVEFAATYPTVKVDMTIGNSNLIKAAVEKGDMDIGICTQTDADGHVICHDPLVWISNKTFSFRKNKTLPLAVFEEDCISRHWAIEALEKTRIKYRIVYVSRSIAGIHNAVRTGLVIAPIVKSTVPPDLEIVGIEEGLPVLPVTNVVLHKTKRTIACTIESFANYLIKSIREGICWEYSRAKRQAIC